MNDEINNPLNLNNLPDDFSERGNGKKAQFDVGSSSSGLSCRKKKKDDESGKVYECRFCSLKFCKSQALGGHMNRHRPERETETLNKARMLVFSNENSISAANAHHLGGFHQSLVDPALHFRPTYPVQPAPMRIPTITHSSTASQIQQNQPLPYLYPSPPRPPSVSYPSLYDPSINDYYFGHVLGITGLETADYTCIGAPVANSNLGSTTNGISIIQDDGLRLPATRGFGGTSRQQLQPAARLDLSLAINRFQERF